MHTICIQSSNDLFNRMVSNLEADSAQLFLSNNLIKCKELGSENNNPSDTNLSSPALQGRRQILQPPPPPKKRGRPKKTKKTKKYRPINKDAHSSSSLVDNRIEDFRLAQWALPLLASITSDASVLCANVSASKNGHLSTHTEDLRSRMKVIRLKITLLEAAVEMLLHSASWTAVEVRTSP